MIHSDNFESSSPVSQVPSTPERGIEKVAQALGKAQAEMIQPVKNKTVVVRPQSKPEYTFDYADYSAIVEAVRPVLSKNGLAFTHLLEMNGSRLELVTRLIHESGQYLECIWPIPASQDPKAIGGAMTYGKRYCLSAITGCVADDDADVDHEHTAAFSGKTAAPRAPDPRPTPSPSPSPIAARIAPRTGPLPIETDVDMPSPCPTQAQLKRLFTIAHECLWTVEHLKLYVQHAYGIESTKDLTRAQYDELIDLVQTKTYTGAVVSGFVQE